VFRPIWAEQHIIFDLLMIKAVLLPNLFRLVWTDLPVLHLELLRIAEVR
jgi:hypothetical protein